MFIRGLGKNKNTQQKRWCVLHRACDSEGTYDLISLDGTSSAKFMIITKTKKSRDRLIQIDVSEDGWTDRSLFILQAKVARMFLWTV